MKTQAEVDRIKLGAKIRYRDALVRFQMKHLDFRLLAADAMEAKNGDNRADAGAVQPEPQPQAPTPEAPSTQEEGASTAQVQPGTEQAIGAGPSYSSG